MKFNTTEKIILLACIFSGAILLSVLMYKRFTTVPPSKHWAFQSIDTMKTSRDLAREELTDPDFAKTVDKQMADIAATGANYVAIGTPYDDEFMPVLTLWVRTARRHGLKVWFRGNFSGWERWFGYPKIDEQEHIAKTKQFILSNSTLFEDGDVFSSCPECENGDHLNVSNPADVVQHRKFLINEYAASKEAFAQIHKNVARNYFSMNADVAKAVMDHETTRELGGIVVIDHYVKQPQELAQDVIYLAQLTGGKVVLGEIGAPIPDINGTMTDQQQQQWLADAMILLASVDQLQGVNYWVNMNGSTALWRPDGTPKPAVDTITRFYGGN